MSRRLQNKLQLVVIDDDPAIVRTVTRLANQALGEHVETIDFIDPHDARRWVDQHCCDVLITDLHLSAVDALEMLRFSKSRNPWTQVIFLTQHTSPQTISEALEIGASDYLVKPLDQSDLVDVLRESHAKFVRWRAAQGHPLQSPATVKRAEQTTISNRAFI